MNGLNSTTTIPSYRIGFNKESREKGWSCMHPECELPGTQLPWTLSSSDIAQLPGGKLQLAVPCFDAGIIGPVALVFNWNRLRRQMVVPMPQQKLAHVSEHGNGADVCIEVLLYALSRENRGHVIVRVPVQLHVFHESRTQPLCCTLRLRANSS